MDNTGKTPDQRVMGCVAEVFGLQEDDPRLKLETTFEELNADSLDLVELTMALEDEFEFSIPDDAADRIKTIGEAIKYVKQNALEDTMA